MKNFIFRAAFRLGSIRSVFLHLREGEHGAVGFLDLARMWAGCRAKAVAVNIRARPAAPPPSRLVPLIMDFMVYPHTAEQHHDQRLCREPDRQQKWRNADGKIDLKAFSSKALGRAARQLVRWQTQTYVRFGSPAPLADWSSYRLLSKFTAMSWISAKAREPRAPVASR